jgi:hypothetical protein
MHQSFPPNGSVRNMQLSLGLPDPRDHSSVPLLKRVMAGISRARLSKRQGPCVRLPITGILPQGAKCLHNPLPGANRIGGPSNGSTGGVGISAMAPSAQSYYRQGLAESTQKSYRAAMKCFQGFCEPFNVSTPFPVMEYTLCSFAAYLADQGLTPQTIMTELSEEYAAVSGPSRPT